MTPSESFYERLRRNEFKDNVVSWEQARLPGDLQVLFLCSIKISTGKKFWGVIYPGENLGDGSIYIPVLTEQEKLKKSRIIGLSWMSEQNKTQFDPAPVANRPGEALEQIGAGIEDLPEDVRSFTSSTNIPGIRLAIEIERSAELEEPLNDEEELPWRERTEGVSKAGLAMGLALYIQSNMSWDIVPIIETTKFFSSKKPI